MILGELETDFDNGEQAASSSTMHLSAQSKQMAAFVREDVEEIVNGSYAAALTLLRLQIPLSTSSSFI